MMDWYSNYPPPSREEAAKEVLIQVQRIKPGDHSAICTKVVNEMPSLGSQTGWVVFFKNDAIQEVLKRI